jgi:hypothetical protein
MTGPRKRRQQPLVIKSAEFFNIELAPLADGTVHVSITATTVDDQEPQLITQEIVFDAAPTIDEALAIIRKAVTVPA